MKNLLKSLVISVFLIPSITLGAIGVGWNATSTDKGGIQPNAVNGNVPYITIPGFMSTGSSTVYASLFHLLGLSDGCLNISSSIIGSTSCGGGSGGGTWSTTTSSVIGQLINYPNNTTDIVAIGSNSTTTAEFWFDPNLRASFLSGSTTIAGNATTTGRFSALYFDASGLSGLATSTFGGGVQITPTTSVGNSISTGGIFNLDNTLNTGAGLVVQSNMNASAAGRLAVFNVRNTAFDQEAILVQNAGTNAGMVINCTLATVNVNDCFNINSSKTDKSAVIINGAPNTLATLKVSPGGLGTGNTSSALLNTDASTGGYLGRAIFAKGALGNDIAELRDNSDNSVLTVQNDGKVGIGSTTPYYGGLNVGNYFAVATSGLMAFGYDPYYLYESDYHTIWVQPQNPGYYMPRAIWQLVAPNDVTGGFTDREATFTAEIPRAPYGYSNGDYTDRNFMDAGCEYFATDANCYVESAGQGSGEPLPLRLGHWDLDKYSSVADVPYANWFDPSGAVGFGYASSTSSTFTPYPLTSQFSVSSSTANTLLLIEDGTTDRLVVSGTGFGTTTISGLAIVGGQATSTSNVGFNITTGCYAIANTCISGSSGGGASDFTFTTNFGVINAATTTPIWAQSGINASSTSHIDYASSTAITLSNWLLATTATVCKQPQQCQFNTVQAALTANWRPINVKQGTFAEQITIANTKTKLVGDSLLSIIQANGSTQSPAITTNVKDETFISGLTLNETNAQLLGVGIDLSDSSLNRLLFNRINNFSTSTTQTDTASNTFYNLTLGNTFFSPRTCQEYSGSQANANTSAFNRCRPMISTTGGYGHFLSDTRGFSSFADDIEGTTTSNGVTGIYIDPTSREISYYNPWVEANTVGINITSGARRVNFFGGSITSNGTDIINNGTDVCFWNVSVTGVTRNECNGNFKITSPGTLYASTSVITKLTTDYSSSTIYSSFQTSSSTNYLGGGLATCTGSNFLQYTASGFFSCAAGGSGGSSIRDFATTTDTLSIYNNWSKLFGFGTATPWAQLSVNPNDLGSGVPEFVVGSSSATHFLINGAGNVGIGTTTPATNSIVDIQRNLAGNLAVSLTNPNANGCEIYNMSNDSSLKKYLKGCNSSFSNTLQLFNGDAGSIQLSTSGSGNIMLLNNGTVGIGTSTPTWTLNPFNAGAAQLALSAGAGVSQWTMRNAGGNLYYSTTTVAGTATSTLSAFNINGSTGNVGIGIDNPGAKLTVSNQPVVQAPVSGSIAQFVGLDANPLRLTFDTHNNSNTSGTAFMFRRSRGTAASPSALVVDDVLGSLNFRGYGTTQYAAGSTGLMTAKAEGTFTDSSNPTALTWDTTPSGSVTAIERMRLTGSGILAVGTTTPFLAQFVSSSSTAPQIILSSGTTGTANWFERTAGGNYYLGTTTVQGLATTTKAALSITNGGVYSISTSTAGVLQTTTGGDLFSGTLTIGNGGTGSTSFSPNSIITSNAAGTALIATTSNLTVSILLSTSTTGWSIFMNDGVNIGTTTPSPWLFNVGSSTTGQLSLQDNIPGDPQWVFRNAGGNLYLATTTTNGLATSSTAALTLNGATGSVGYYFGTTSPGYTGPTGISAVGTMKLFGLSTATTLNSVCINATTKEIVDAGANTCNASSKFLKNELGELSFEEAKSIIDRMREVIFEYKDKPEEEYYGFMAEEVEKIDPRLVDHAEEDMTVSGHFFKKGDPYGVNYWAYTAVLSAYVKGIETPETQNNYMPYILLGFALLVAWNVGLTYKRKWN